METVDDDFMDSFTPPLLSDSLQMAMEVENEKSNPPCFSCIFDNQNGGRSFSDESYLVSGSLKRVLLRLDPSPNDYEEPAIEMFGFQWVTESALVESCGLLFGLLRQQIYKLEDLIETNSSDFGQAVKLYFLSFFFFLYFCYVKNYLFKGCKQYLGRKHESLLPQ
uniref:MMS22 like, DNA repair protein n=1 Tax=Coturnix japonica TaxID=93934 RepID=A0A8C2SKJ6_COTJA